MSESSLLDTTLLDRYRVISVLGEGAMGCVYLADDLQLKRQVALKVLRQEWVRQQEVRQRLENECQIMARLGPHSHIVTLFDRLEHNGDIILVMEYVPGETLAAVLDRIVSLNAAGEAARKTTPLLAGMSTIALQPHDIVKVTIQCLDALDFAHSRGILHRDIKPSNIMLARDHNGSLVAKIMDFGIGKALSGDDGGQEIVNLTRAGAPGPGTPAYMAPEQIDPQRFGPLGPHTDLYALGVTLYEMLTARPPFLGTYTELLIAHTTTQPPDPQNFSIGISPDMKWIALKSLQKEPKKRYQTASVFKADLLAAAKTAGGTLLQQQDFSTPGGSPNRPRKSRAPWLAAIVCLLLVLCGGGFWYIQQQQPPPGPAKQGESTQTDQPPVPNPTPDPPVKPVVTPVPPVPDSPELKDAKEAAAQAEQDAKNAIQNAGLDPATSSDMTSARKQLQDASNAAEFGKATAAFKAININLAAAVSASTDAENAKTGAEGRYGTAAGLQENGSYTEGNRQLDLGKQGLDRGDYQFAAGKYQDAKEAFNAVQPPEPAPKPVLPPNPDLSKLRDDVSWEKDQAEARFSKAGKQIKDDSNYRKGLEALNRAIGLEEEKKPDSAENAKKEYGNAKGYFKKATPSQDPHGPSPEEEKRARAAASDARAARDNARKRLEGESRVPDKNTAYNNAENTLREAERLLKKGDFSEATKKFRAAKSAFEAVTAEPINAQLSEVVNLERQAMDLRDGLLSQQKDLNFKAGADLLAQGTKSKVNGNLDDAKAKFQQAIQVLGKLNK